MRHLLPRPFGYGGEQRLALVVQRAGPKPTDAICTMARGIACAHVTSEWNHVYPLGLADAVQDDHLLPGSDTWAENLSAELAARLEEAYGRRPGVEEVAWYVFAALSAPSYRQGFAPALAIDHPRVPFPAAIGGFERAAELGRRLGAAHLLEAPVRSDIRFAGEGSGVVEQIRHIPDAACVAINGSQRFTGVPADAWAWGLGFRPLEHFLSDRKGRRLDAAQIAMFQSAINAVRESLELAPELDAILSEILVDTLELT
jgi:predicted helicase